jgi:hypothetical protein
MPSTWGICPNNVDHAPTICPILQTSNSPRSTSVLQNGSNVSMKRNTDLITAQQESFAIIVRLQQLFEQRQLNRQSICNEFRLLSLQYEKYNIHNYTKAYIIAVNDIHVFGMQILNSFEYNVAECVLAFGSAVQICK